MKISREYANAFSDIDCPIYVYTANFIEFFILSKSVIMNGIQLNILYYPELFTAKLKKDSFRKLIIKAKEYLNDQKFEYFVIYGAQKEQISFFEGMTSFKSIRHYYELTSPQSLSSNIRRKVNKCRKTYQTIINKHTFLKEGLELVRFMDYYKRDFTAKEIIKFESLFSCENAISIFLIKKKHVVACMLGININEIAYMLIHYYNPNYKSYINEGLYFEFIEYSRSLGLTSVDWGMTNLNDSGLNDFKKQFSTKYNICHNIIIPKNK